MHELARSVGRPLAGLVIAVAAFWLVVLVAVPLVTMLGYSLSSRGSNADAKAALDRAYADLTLAQFDRQAEHDADKAKALDERIATLQSEITRLDEAVKGAPPRVWGVQNYLAMSALHARIFVRTILSALAVTFLAFVLCYPVACAAAFASNARKTALLVTALLVPYALNELLRVYAWLMLFDYRGVINSLLAFVGLTDPEQGRSIPFVEESWPVFTALLSVYVVFMVLPIMNTLQTLDKNQIEAARDLGASTLRLHWRIILPHAKPGIAVGCITVFMLAAGTYAVPQIMSRGLNGDWFSQLVYRQFFESNNWNTGAAYACALLLVCLAVVFALMRAFKVGLEDITR